MGESKNRDRMKQALAGHIAKPIPSKAAMKQPAKKETVAAAAKKRNPRSAAARDTRAKTRGRLPENTWVTVRYEKGVWRGEMHLAGTHGASCKAFVGTADGQFRCMEELDVQFWNWFAKEGDEDVKKRLVFDPVDRKPEPLPEELKRGES